MQAQPGAREDSREQSPWEADLQFRRRDIKHGKSRVEISLSESLSERGPRGPSGSDQRPMCPRVSRSAGPTLCDPMDCSPPGSSFHGILQARILEWVAISFSTILV